MSLAVRLFVIDYAFIHSSGKKRQQNFPPFLSSFAVLQKPLQNVGFSVAKFAASENFNLKLTSDIESLFWRALPRIAKSPK